jgi:hypothetical protein
VRRLVASFEAGKREIQALSATSSPEAPVLTVQEPVMPLEAEEEAKVAVRIRH